MSKEISFKELAGKVTRGETVFIAEILPEPYYRSGHLPGARHLPLDGFEGKVRSVLPDAHAEVVVYCSGPTCQNSHIAARKLDELGYSNVRVFSGGKAGWKDAGGELEIVA
jgi:rhodanese-related sulfurtransferase